MVHCLAAGISALLFWKPLCPLFENLTVSSLLSWGQSLIYKASYLSLRSRIIKLLCVVQHNGIGAEPLKNTFQEVRLLHFGGDKEIYCILGKPGRIYNIDQMSLVDAYKCNILLTTSLSFAVVLTKSIRNTLCIFYFLYFTWKYSLNNL